MCLFVGELELCFLIVASSWIVKPICGQKSQEDLGTKVKCHRKCARTKEEVWRTKVGHRKEVKPQNNLDFSSVEDFDFQCTAVVFLGCLMVLWDFVNT